MKKIYSWNVNGIRAAHKKGFLDFLKHEQPDILCVQETKAHPDQLPASLKEPEGYKSWFSSAERKGYSGTAIYSKAGPKSVTQMGVSEFDSEGRTLIADYGDLVVITAYFPNSQAEGKRLDYKLRFCDAMLETCSGIVSSGKNLVLCGDYNIAHKPIDLARPKSNENNPGYLPEERAWMDTFTGEGYADTFRMFNEEPDNYSWWSYRMNAREKNIGWRIDYHCVNKEFTEAVSSAGIRPDVMGSDHCPVTLELSV